MGNLLSTFGLLPSSEENYLSSSIISSQLVHRHTLSTCYDSIFDVSLSSTDNSILLSDDGRLRLFDIDFANHGRLIERTASTSKVLVHEQIHEIIWSTELEQFLVLTSKRLTTYDQENNLINLDLGLEKGRSSVSLSHSFIDFFLFKGSPPFWRMACWSSHLVVNLGLGTSIRYHRLIPSLSTVPFIKSYTRASLGYSTSDLLSSLTLSPQLILAINVELTNNQHIIDLFSMVNPSNFQLLQRISSHQPCPLDIITSLRDYTWLCKSHWPSDDCLCLIQSNGQVTPIDLQEQDGYILNLRLLADRSHLALIRTPQKLPKEVPVAELNRIDQEEDQATKSERRRTTIGKLPGNLLLEIYRIPSIDH